MDSVLPDRFLVCTASLSPDKNAAAPVQARKKHDTQKEHIWWNRERYRARRLHEINHLLSQYHQSRTTSTTQLSFASWCHIQSKALTNCHLTLFKHMENRKDWLVTLCPSACPWEGKFCHDPWSLHRLFLALVIPDCVGRVSFLLMCQPNQVCLRFLKLCKPALQTGLPSGSGCLGWEYQQLKRSCITSNKET